MRHPQQQQQQQQQQEEEVGATATAPSPRMLQALISSGSVGGLLFGYDTGIISGALVLLSDDFSLNSLEKSLVVSVCIGGAFFSAAVSGYLSDRYGRRVVVLASSIAFIVGSLLLSIATSTLMLYLGRFIVGVGVGSASMIVPILLSECAPAASRGSIVTCVNVAVTFGQVIACAVAGSLSSAPYGWRIMLGVAAFPALIQLLMFWFIIPESPRWLLSQGHVDRGTLALRQLRDAYDVREELQEILESLQNEKDAIAAEFGRRERAREREREAAREKQQLAQGVLSPPLLEVTKSSSPSTGLNSPYQKTVEDLSLLTSKMNSVANTPSLVVESIQTKLSFCELFSSKVAVRRALSVGIVLQVTQQLAGINTVMYYSATIFSGTGIVSQSTAIWLTLGTASANFIGSLVSLKLTDRVGRRPLTLYSLQAVCVCLVGISLTFKFNDVALDVGSTSGGGGGSSSSSSSSSKVWSVFAAIYLYLLVFSVGIGSMPWTICSEIFPLSTRGVGAAITTSTNWAANLAVSLTFLTVCNRLGAVGTFSLYAAITGVFTVWLAIYLPETRGLQLEEVGALFDDAQWGTLTPFPKFLSDCIGACTGDATPQATRPRGWSRGFYSALSPVVREEYSEGSQSVNSAEGEEEEEADRASFLRRLIRL